MGEELERVSVIWKIVSFLFPLVGIALYFVWRKKYENSGSILLWAIIGAVVFNILRRLVA